MNKNQKSRVKPSLELQGMVSELLATGWDKHQITKAAKKNGISQKKVHDAVDYVLHTWRKQSEADMPLKRSRHIHALNTLLRKSMSRNDIKTSLCVLQQKMEVEGTKFDPRQITDNEIKFNISIVGNPDGDEGSGYDDLDRPDAMERRTEKQFDSYCNEYGIKKRRND